MAPPAGRPRGSGSTTKAGRSWFTVPRPYDTHAPMHGKPFMVKPVFIWNAAGVWFELGDHRVKKRQVVHALRQVREEVAHPLAALAVLLERERAFQQPAGLAEEGVDFALAGQLLSVMLCEVRLVVEGIDMADAAGAEDLHDALGLRRKVRAARSGRGGGSASPAQTASWCSSQAKAIPPRPVVVLAEEIAAGGTIAWDVIGGHLSMSGSPGLLGRGAGGSS